MPAEWEPQSATWLSWPHNVETWPDNLRQAQSEFVELVKLIANHQQVYVLASPDARDLNASLAKEAHKIFANCPNVEIINIPTNDAWARDYAPTFVTLKTETGASELVAIDWHYNAWGGKYPPFDDDQKVARHIAESLNLKRVDAKFCFEGGAIEVNGSGVLLSTKSCALDPNRNPDHTLEQVDTLLASLLGTQKHIWLSGDAIEGDDTDGHIDQLARFVNETTIVYAWADDKDDPQLVGLQQNLTDLREGLDSNGLGHYKLVALPIPKKIEIHGRRIPASYCNFLITNEMVVVPQFSQPEDDQAIAILKDLFAGRKIVGLPSLNLSVGLGSFHCLSQQQPK